MSEDNVIRIDIYNTSNAIIDGVRADDIGVIEKYFEEMRDALDGNEDDVIIADFSEVVDPSDEFINRWLELERITGYKIRKVNVPPKFKRS